METFSDDFYPLALLMDELKHDDVSNRVDAMQKVDAIAIALGPERTVNELLPFLNDVAQDDEEEVFAVMAEKLGSFVPLVGGHVHAEPLVHILASLAAMEEPIVRDKAVELLNTIAGSLLEAQLTGVFLELVRLLSLGDWFSKKVALCGLYKLALDRVDASTRHDLLTLYHTLVSDDLPMVRRLAAKYLPGLVDKLELEADLELVSKMFHHLINDAQDLVKLLAIDVLVAILLYLKRANDTSHNLDCLVSALKLILDELWRVRYAAADAFSSIANKFPVDADLYRLVDPFIALMKDNEGEVRKAIARQLPGFCALVLDLSVVESKILPVVAELSQDPHENVRAALASTVTGLLPLLPKQTTVDSLLPVFLTMLKDEFPDVRLNIISNLSVVNDTIGISLLSTSLLPAITELAQDTKWRVRLAIIEYIPKLASQLGELFFNNELLALCMLWLWDSVYAVRDAAVNNLRELTVIFGPAWAEEHIVLRLLTIRDDKMDDEGTEHVDFSNFIIRITCLFAFTRLIPVIGQAIVLKKILPFINQLVADPVPNIRFNVAKLYLVAAQALALLPQPEAAINELDIVANVSALLSDLDVDVRYYANQSAERIQEILKT